MGTIHTTISDIENANRLKKNVSKAVNVPAKPIDFKRDSKEITSQELKSKMKGAPWYDQALVRVLRLIPENVKAKLENGVIGQGIEKNYTRGGVPMTKQQINAIIKKGGDPEKILPRIARSDSSAQGRKFSMEQIRPFYKVMRTTLREAGKPTPIGLEAVANEFYNSVVRRDIQQDDTPDRKFSYPKVDIFQVTENNADDAKDIVIGGIIDYIRLAKDRYESGQNVTGFEKFVARGAQVVEANAEEAARKQAATRVGNTLLFDTRIQFILLGVVGLIIFLIFKKS